MNRQQYATTKLLFLQNRTSLTTNVFTMMSVVASNMRHGFYKLHLCYLRVVYFLRVGQKHDVHINYSYE